MYKFRFILEQRNQQNYFKILFEGGEGFREGEKKRWNKLIDKEQNTWYGWVIAATIYEARKALYNWQPWNYVDGGEIYD